MGADLELRGEVCGDLVAAGADGFSSSRSRVQRGTHLLQLLQQPLFLLRCLCGSLLGRSASCSRGGVVLPSGGQLRLKVAQPSHRRVRSGLRCRRCHLRLRQPRLGRLQLLQQRVLLVLRNEDTD